MAQIQYPAYTQPVAIAAPPSVDTYGWRRTQPDDVSQGVRGRYPRGKLITALQTVGAVVFAVEQFALPKPLVAKAYVPDNPQQFIHKADQRAKGGAYRNAPWVFWTPDPENWALPKPYAAAAELPDRPRHYFVRSRLATGQWFTTDLRPPSAAQTGTDWMTAWPAQTPKLARRSVSLLTTDVDVLSPEFFPPTLEWSATYPDTTSRDRLAVAQLPTYTSGEDQAEIAQWTVVFPDTTRRTRLPVALYPAMFRGETLDKFPATLLWSATYPDTTRRASLSTADLPTSFRGEAIEQFRATLLWGSYAPETTRRARLGTAPIPSAFTGQLVPIVGPTLLWSVTAPPTTSRRHLDVAQIPTQFRSDPFASSAVTLLWGTYTPNSTSRAQLTTAQLPTLFVGSPPQIIQLGWGAFYPNTTDRLSLDIATIAGNVNRLTTAFYVTASGQLPLLFCSVMFVPVDSIVNRRPTENPGTVGDRSPDTRMGGL